MEKKFLLSSLAVLCAVGAEAQNVIIINADDLGYGDVSCNGGIVPTPNVDRVAASGIKLTNVHATSATSTPSRFSLLTGTYAWREPGRGVAPGDAAMLIKPTTKTLPQMMQRAGYKTAAVGKWHLGIGDKTGGQNWNKVIKPGLSDIGFDYSYIMAATADRVPCVYIEQGTVVGLDPTDPIEVSYSTPFDCEPTGKNNPELLTMKSSHGHDNTIVNGIGRIGYMKGGKNALWVDQNIVDSITTHAVDFIKASAKDKFFLYFATNDVHVPRVPHPRFVGRSGLGARGDAILEFDFSVGEILKTLDSLGLTQNTILIITSDNGPVVDDGYCDEAVQKLGLHKPWGEFRGGKYSIFEAGTSVPTFVMWPATIGAGEVSDAMVSQVDFFASLTAMTHQSLSKDEAIDSHNMWPAIIGRDPQGRAWLIQDAYARSIVMDGWKYIAPSDGQSYNPDVNIELGCNPQPQLYNMNSDRAEKYNLADKYPKIVQKLAEKLKSIEDGALQ